MKEPHMQTINGKRWTVLDCEIGNHSGVFQITLTTQGWGCDSCLAGLLSAGSSLSAGSIPEPVASSG